MHIYKYRLISLVGRVFANGQGHLRSIPGRVILKTLKVVPDTSLRNTQQYKVRIKGKVEQSRERSNALPYTKLALDNRMCWYFHKTQPTNHSVLAHSSTPWAKKK